MAAYRHLWTQGGRAADDIAVRGDGKAADAVSITEGWQQWVMDDAVAAAEVVRGGAKTRGGGGAVGFRGDKRSCTSIEHGHPVTRGTRTAYRQQLITSAAPVCSCRGSTA